VEEIPGFAIGFELVMLVAGANADRMLHGGHAGRDDVPDIGRNAVHGEIVEIRGAITVVLRSGMVEAGYEVTGLEVTSLKVSGFNLNADEMSMGIDDDVVGNVVAHGLGDLKAEFSRLGHKTELGPLAARFVIANAYT